MTINFDLVIKSEKDEVDMKAGLDTMQGVSDAMRCTAEAVLTGKTPKRQSHKSKVRTTLKKSFKGSYGHTFSLDISDNKLLDKLQSIGKKPFIELITYFLSEALYKDSKPLSRKAEAALEKLGETAEEVVTQLRVSSLENIHEISTKFDHDVKIRHRETKDNKTTIAEFDRQTAKVLQIKPTNKKVDLTVSVTRFNIYTGNGRLQIKGKDRTVAFGFDIEYHNAKHRGK